MSKYFFHHRASGSEDPDTEDVEVCPRSQQGKSDGIAILSWYGNL